MIESFGPGCRVSPGLHAGAPDEQDEVVELALASLDPKQWEITRTPVFTTATRRWPGDWMDTLLVLDPQRTQGQRDNPLNRVVWQRFGMIGEVAAALNALPAPGQPGAPAMPLPGRDEDMP